MLHKAQNKQLGSTKYFVGCLQTNTPCLWCGYLGGGHDRIKRFFQDHVPLAKGRIIKAFASETVSIMQVLMIVCECVLQPRGILSEHVRCLLLAGELLEYFCMGDEVGHYNERMRVIAREHHILCLKLYNLEMITPKFHYLYHAIKPRNMNTLNPERLHKPHKGVAEHVFGQGFESSVLHRAILRYVTHVQEPQHYMEVTHQHASMKRTKGHLEFDRHLKNLLPGLIDIQYVKSLQTPTGLVHELDVVLVKSASSTILGRARLLAHGRLVGSEARLYSLIVDVFRHTSNGVWNATGAKVYLPISAYLRSVPSMLGFENSGVFPLIPARYKGSVSLA